MFRPAPLKPHYRIAGLYIVLGAAWIWCSDRALVLLMPAGPAWVALQNLKGWLFVLVSGVLIAAIAGRYFRRLQSANRALLDGHEQAIRVMIAAMDARHRETRDHSQRVARMTVALARLAGIRDAMELRRIEFGALLHDVGKLALPDAILIKPGPLTGPEMAQIRTHPDSGRSLLERIDFLRPCTDIPYCHHERWDGDGYPRGLRGEAIPLPARLFAVVDVWDALRHPRVYKQAWPDAEVIDYLRGQAGRQFDPAVVDLFLEHYAFLTGLAGEEQARVPCTATTSASVATEAA